MKFVRNSVSFVTDKTLQPHWLPILLRLVAITLGGLHTWAAITSYSMNADGIAYLDIGEAYLQGDWRIAINAYWSPFYSWLLGLGMRMLNPSMFWEFPVVHLMNFLIYLVTLACFEFFWHQLMRFQRDKRVGKGGVTLPEWAWLVLGYMLFIWSSLKLIEIWAVTPDMVVAAVVYLAAGLIVRIQAGTATWRTSALLGMVLGVGYLSKAAMFPLAFVFLGVSLFSVADLRRAVLLTLIALTFFALVGGPFIVALSLTKGHPTFGDSGKLNYARYVNGLPDVHWRGEISGSGTPIHPTRKIFDAPAIYEFATPIWGSYPPWYDPSYWYEGVALHFDLKEQSRVLVSSAQSYFDLFFRQQGGLTAVVLIFYLMRHRWSLQVKGIAQQWGLVVLALAAFGMYALVLVEERYIGAFVVLLWAGLLANVRLPDCRASSRLASVLSAIMILFMLMNILAFNLAGFSNLTSSGNRNQRASEHAGPPSWPGEVAEELHRLGVEPGDSVAIIGYAFDAYWARLARVQIVAEMFDWEADPFWLGNPSFQSEVIQTFASTGAKAIVAEHVPGYASLVGWHQVGNSNHYIYLFAK